MTTTDLDALLDDDPALRARLHDADAGVRRIALIELAELEDETLVPWLVAALADAAPAVREEAARRLAAWEREDGVHALVAALSDTNAAVRASAADSLAELQQTDSGVWLLPALAHAEPFVRASALRALKALRQPQALGPALALLADADPSVRLEAVGVIGWLKATAALPRLAQLTIGDPAADVRRAAAAALGCATTVDAGLHAALCTALGDADWTVREEAATTLAKLRWAGALPPLVGALADPYWQVALRAARAIGRFGRAGAPALTALLPLLDAPVANLRKEVCIALGELAEPAALPALERAAADPDPDVRKLARLAITALGAAAVRAANSAAAR